jgi:hypothetical protein
MNVPARLAGFGSDSEHMLIGHLRRVGAAGENASRIGPLFTVRPCPARLSLADRGWLGPAPGTGWTGRCSGGGPIAVTGSPFWRPARAIASTSSSTAWGPAAAASLGLGGVQPVQGPFADQVRSISAAIAATMNSILPAIVAPSGRCSPAQIPVRMCRLMPRACS